MKFSLEQLVYVAAQLLIITLIGTIAGYWMGKWGEKALESPTEETPSKKQDG
jgi:membrane protein YqaA with SNARE-associated domain